MEKDTEWVPIPGHEGARCKFLIPSLAGPEALMLECPPNMAIPVGTPLYGRYEVVLKGGFPEEMLRPIREALGWALSSLLALHKDHEPGGDLPSPRLVQSELVEPGRLEDELVARLARVRELTEPAAGDETAPPPSLIWSGPAAQPSVKSMMARGPLRSM